MSMIYYIKASDKRIVENVNVIPGISSDPDHRLVDEDIKVI